MGQFSGAAWHPMCYAGAGTFDDKHVLALCAAHQLKTRDRFLRVCRSLSARKWVPCSGPACFLHEDLCKYNSVDAASKAHAIFPDAYDVDFGTGTPVCRVMPGACFTSSSLVDTPIDPIDDKLGYLSTRYHKRLHRCTASALKVAIDRFQVHTDKLLKTYGSFLSTKISLSLFLELQAEKHVLHTFHLDFEAASLRIIKEAPREAPFYVVTMPAWIFEQLVAAENWDWEEAFLGLWCHFERVPDVYNPWILAFFKNLEMERLSIMRDNADRKAVQVNPSVMPGDQEEFFYKDGWKIPRFCPHQGVDLSKHSDIEDGVAASTACH